MAEQTKIFPPHSPWDFLYRLRARFKSLSLSFMAGSSRTVSKSSLSMRPRFFVARCPRETFRRRVGGKKGRRDHVNAFVRALCRKHNRYEALERRSEDKFALCYRHVGFKPSQYMFKALFGRHDKCDLGIVTLELLAFAHLLFPE